MKSTNFIIHMSKFFKIYLTSDRNLSAETIKSYSQTFSIFLKFMRVKNGICLSSIQLSDFTRKNVENFLRFLEKKGNSPSTINQRKSALCSFCNYLKYEEPSIISELEAISSIK